MANYTGQHLPKKETESPRIIAVYQDGQVRFNYGPFRFYHVGKKHSQPPPAPAYIYIYVCVCPGFAIVTWFLSAIIIHKGLKVTSGAINHCEEKIVQIIIIASLF